MKAGHGEICSLLERYGAAPPPSSPTRSRHRWKQMTPTGATKSTQQTQSHRHHRQLHHSQQLQSRPDRETASADHNASGFAGFGGSIKMGSVVMTSGSTILPQAQLSQSNLSHVELFYSYYFSRNGYIVIQVVSLFGSTTQIWMITFCNFELSTFEFKNS